MLSRLSLILFFSWACIGMAVGPATAGSHSRTCALVDSDYVQVDGMIDDWKSIKGTKVGAGADASFTLRCAYDAENLYLAMHVADQRLVRTRKAKVRAEDHVTISLRAAGKPLKLTVLPGSRTSKRKLILPRGSSKWLVVEDSLQPKGFSVEIRLPRTKIDGVGPNTPALSAKVAYHDTDAAMAGKIQRVRRFSGWLHMEAGLRTYRAFMSNLKLRRADIRLDRLADVDAVSGAERVIVGGKHVGVLSDQFAYMQLPIQSTADLKKIQLVDFDGDGRSFLLGQYRQFGGGGAREVVSVWEFQGNGSFRQILAFEVSKELAGAMVSSKWELVPRGSLRKLGRRESKRGFDILVEAGESKGFDSSNWNEAPATDVQPILLPWAEEKAALYFFTGNVAQIGTPLPKKLKAMRRK